MADISNGIHSLIVHNSTKPGKYIVIIENKRAKVKPVALKLDALTLEALKDVIFNRD